MKSEINDKKKFNETLDIMFYANLIEWAKGLNLDFNLGKVALYP